MRSITKWCATVTDPRRLREMTQTALRQSMAGIPGPVFLELPFDVLTSQVEDSLAPPPLPELPLTMADPAGVERAVALLLSASKPVLFVGSQLWWDDGAAALVKFCELARIPVVMNAMGRGALPSHHPLALNLSRKRAFRQTDLAFIIGTPLDFRVGFGAGISPNAKVIQLDRDPTQLGKNRATDLALAGNARLVLSQLCEALGTDAGAMMRARLLPWVEELRAEEAKQYASLLPYLKSDSRPTNHYRLGAALAEALGAGEGRSIDPEAIVIGDGAM